MPRPSCDVALQGLAPACLPACRVGWGTGDASGQQRQVFHLTRVVLVPCVLRLPPLFSPPYVPPPRPTPPPLAAMAGGLHGGLCAAAASPSLPGRGRGGRPRVQGRGHVESPSSLRDASEGGGDVGWKRSECAYRSTLSVKIVVRALLFGLSKVVPRVPVWAGGRV